MLRYPHLILFIPGVIRAPYFQTYRIFAAGLGNEDSFRGMRDFCARDNHHFFRDTLIDKNTIALAHRDAILPSPLAIHARKLSSPKFASK